jgi:hypothetical protein
MTALSTILEPLRASIEHAAWVSIHMVNSADDDDPNEFWVAYAQVDGEPTDTGYSARTIAEGGGKTKLEALMNLGCSEAIRWRARGKLDAALERLADAPMTVERTSNASNEAFA